MKAWLPLLCNERPTAIPHATRQNPAKQCRRPEQRQCHRSDIEEYRGADVAGIVATHDNAAAIALEKVLCSTRKDWHIQRNAAVAAASRRTLQAARLPAQLVSATRVAGDVILIFIQLLLTTNEHECSSTNFVFCDFRGGIKATPGASGRNAWIFALVARKG